MPTADLHFDQAFAYMRGGWVATIDTGIERESYKIYDGSLMVRSEYDRSWRPCTAIAARLVTKQGWSVRPSVQGTKEGGS